MPKIQNFGSLQDVVHCGRDWHVQRVSTEADTDEQEVPSATSAAIFKTQQSQIQDIMTSKLLYVVNLRKFGAVAHASMAKFKCSCGRKRNFAFG